MKIEQFTDEAQEFIQAHIQDEVTTLALQAKRYPHLPLAELVAQIKARQKAKVKLPQWFANPQLIFPSALSVEQCSSETTALLKASLISGESLLDLTGGMGVDIAYMSQQVSHATYLEQQADLATLTAHNLNLLGIQNVTCLAENSIEWLQKQAPTTTRFSWIYLDPHRRDDTGNKVVLLQDCEPNILAIKNVLFQYSDHILLKASPMLDIDLALRSLENVCQVWVVAVENEVKEVLFHLTKESNNNPSIEAINLLKDGTVQKVSFKKAEEEYIPQQLSKPLRYLYEPNAAILKSGAFKMLCHQLHIHKIAAHSHLYTSEALLANFPGRTFEIVQTCKLDKKEISTLLKSPKANITVRNFPMTVKQIREKLKLQEGGEDYLFATTDMNNQKIIILTKKVTST
jgi:hypothetical protein